ERHIRHPPTPVPSDHCPFRHSASLDVFERCLDEVRAAQILPAGYGIQQAEWEGAYPDVEYIKRGRNRHLVTVPLPFVVWWPRAVAWVQGLDIMMRILLLEDGWA
ncbi:hypothetical protein FKP32DRAFT_1561177, partial [Trametes sanguinea]